MHKTTALLPGNPHACGDHPGLRVLLDPPPHDQRPPKHWSRQHTTQRDGKVPQDDIHAHGISKQVELSKYVRNEN